MDGVDLRSCRRSGDRTRLRIPTWVWQGTHPNIMAKRIITTPTIFQLRTWTTKRKSESQVNHKRYPGRQPVKTALTLQEWTDNGICSPTPACRVYLRLSVFDFWHVCHKATRECSVSLRRRLIKTSSVLGWRKKHPRCSAAGCRHLKCWSRSTCMMAWCPSAR